MTTYSLETTQTVRRMLTERLPEPVAVAAYQFMTGPLNEAPVYTAAMFSSGPSPVKSSGLRV
ncbi:hypothetical protein [Nocardia bovistercoris]|uniref:Uncharacterized protein n=1 Tax=Nocardia bovistercoris TaxID=2785916 RepID=A0A931ICE3_9NOCA|nr:hypothetical protein [Nocardia bovistercoris]MBH0779067.1 hypothetical protein [Nocardia bovistercoris]